MSKNAQTRKNHPLSRRHTNRIANRPGALRKALQHVWGVTWNLRGRRMVRLGSASMMVMSYHRELCGSANAIELLCVTGGLDPATGTIDYSQIRMAHDFNRTPFAGARERVLDPRDEGTPNTRRGDRPNGSWVRLAFEVDRSATRAVEQNWKLASIPNLPAFYAGFPSMSAIDMEVTPALIREIANHMGRSPEYVMSLGDPAILALGSTHWPGLWRAPGTEGNDTGMWLINTAFITKLDQTPHIFEDFSGLLGVEVWNPIRAITAIQLRNPTIECAEAQGINLEAMMAAIAKGSDACEVAVNEADDAPHNAAITDDPAPPMTPTQFVCSYDEAVDQLLLLRNCVRGTLGVYGRHFTDDQINHALMHPKQQLQVALTDAAKDLQLEDAVALCRQHLDKERPLVSAGTTDDDLRNAIQNPDAPLFASKMCQIQILRRDIRQAPADAFSFTPSTLGRDRVRAHLWAGNGWTPRGAAGTRNDKGGKHAHATVRTPETAAVSE